MSSQIQRFYLDWGIYPGEEVTREEALDEGDYTRAQFDESHALLFAEFYDSGSLFHIDYWATDPESTRGEHLARHPGVPFGIQSTVQRIGSHQWSISYRYAGSGDLAGYLVHLERINTYDAALMTLQIDLQRQLKKIEKNSYDGDGQLHYAFEYNPEGEVVSIRDSLEGSTPQLATALDDVDMPDFYREGFSLPAGIDRSSIPFLGE
ncbi:hypothetical protein [Streptomyces catenulae]|uniref:Uncharacterized protein n=1 Tax=Streptomyces catenulae TaxID=66875 RepID=A0ABV2YW31_9ACTN|nr:hypothetical protein [Streptomyces catenulae]